MVFSTIEKIGHGGFGIVYKVSDSEGNEFAMKTFSINQSNFPKELEENVRKRFIREANIQKEISHDNIVPILFSFLNEDPPRFVMKLAISSLADDIQKERTLNGKYLDAILDILAGLEEIHSMGIYHRDLKPANILRFRNSRDYYAIGDFGLMSINQTQLSTLTQTGMRMGSDYYTAPEIVKNLRKASIQSDIYSIGCIIHDFVGVDDRIPCGEIDEEGDYAGILKNCTRKDPSRRFKSVKHLREALLSLGDISVSPSTHESERFFIFLDKGIEEITENNWKEIISFIEDKYDNEDTISLMRKITIQQIDYLINNFEGLSDRLGLMYSKWIRNSSFSFESCDGLSIRLSKFIDDCNINVKTECLMAMLYLGTEHNRWYVERMFASYIGNSLEINLARRLAIEFINDAFKAKRAIKHLTISIHFNTANLHPRLLEAYNKL